MDLPDENPKNEAPKKSPKKNKAEKSRPEIDLSPEMESVARIVAASSAGLVHSRAKLNMLSFLLHECRLGETQRSPEDQIGRNNVERNRAEKFLLDRSESPLKEGEEVSRYFQLLDTPIQNIDESDPEQKTLGEFLKKASPEKFEEVKRATEQLLKEDTINERIQEILLQSSPELVEDYQAYDPTVGELALEQNLNRILGDNPDKKTEKEFRQILKEEEKGCKFWSLLEAEKARILCNALTLPKDSERRPQLLEEAKRVLGEDTVRLVEEQVNHTNNTILRLYASEAIPSNTPEELVCPSILQRMGEGGPDKQQLKVLSEIQEFYLFRRGETPPSGEELAHQTTRAALAALYIIERGRWIGYTNTLKEFQEVQQSRKQDYNKFAYLNQDKDPERAEELEPHYANEVPHPKKTQRSFEKKISKIEKIIDTYNEGVTDDEHKADKKKIINSLRKLSIAKSEGLMELNIHDVQKTGAPKLLAAQIANYIEKQKAASKRIRKAILNKMGQHNTKLQQKLFRATANRLKEELSDKEKSFTKNEDTLKILKELGVYNMDQPL